MISIDYGFFPLGRISAFHKNGGAWRSLETVLESSVSGIFTEVGPLLENYVFNAFHQHWDVSFPRLSGAVAETALYEATIDVHANAIHMEKPTGNLLQDFVEQIILVGKLYANRIINAAAEKYRTYLRHVGITPQTIR